MTTLRTSRRHWSGKFAKAGATQQSGGASAYDLLRLAIALLLLGAAGLKAYGVAHGTAATHPWTAPHVALEAALGLWLLSGRFPRSAWWVTLVTFFGFAGYSVYSLVAGAADCGCFGPVGTSPWLMIGLNTVVIALLVILRPRSGHAGMQPLSWPLIAAAAGATLPLLVVMSLSPAASIDLEAPASDVQDSPAGQSSQTISTFVSPASWPGQRLELLPMIDISRQLSEGRWQVMFYRHTCDRCHEQLDRWLGMASSVGEENAVGRAVVEIPPYGDEDELVDLVDALGWVTGKLSDRRAWRFASPQFVELKEGVVQHVRMEPMLIETE